MFKSIATHRSLLYLAASVMLVQEHPSLTKSEKMKICGLMDCRKLSTDACIHAVQNERLPLRVVVQVLFFQQMRASAATSGSAPEGPSNVKPVFLRENGGSYGSSRSAITINTEEDWVGVPITGDLKTTNLAARGGGSQRSTVGSNVTKQSDGKADGKVKGILMPKKMLSKLWSGKGQGCDNSSSYISESPSPDSINQEDSKSTHSRNTRHSVS